MMHDLFVHQVELEQQNRELQAMQEKLEESRDRYADLYDFAPVAYVTVDAKGSVQEINLAGAELLGKERQDLIGVSLAGFAEPGNRRVVLSLLRRLSESDGPCSEVFSLTSADGRKLIVRAQGHAERAGTPALYRPGGSHRRPTSLSRHWRRAKTATGRSRSIPRTCSPAMSPQVFSSMSHRLAGRCWVTNRRN